MQPKSPQRYNQQMKNKPKKLPLKTFLSIYRQVPRLTIELIVKTNQGVLLSKRSIPPYKGYWHIPGGTILLHEKITSALNRIALEETGLKLKVLKLLGPIEYHYDGGDRHTVGLAYLCEPLSGKPKGSTQGEEIRFFKSIPSKTIATQKKFLKTLV